MNEPTVRVLQRNTTASIRAELAQVGAELSVETAAFARTLDQAQFSLVKLTRVNLPLARLLYQELVMEGGQVVTTPRLDHVGDGETDVLLCGTRYQLNHLLIRLRMQPSEELQLLAAEIERALDAFRASPPPLELAGKRFDWSERPYVMGILNLTPDSFSGDALLREDESTSARIERIVARAEQLARDGADVLDVGGESTRPGAVPVDAATELERVAEPLRAIHAATALPISIDTTKAQVAAVALQAGAAMVNDVSALDDPAMARVVAEHGAALILMHNGAPEPIGTDFIAAMLEALRPRIDRAVSAGVEPQRLLIDPGLGFGKSVAQNLELLNRLGEFRVLGCPIVIGPSRKGFISKSIGVPVTERVEGTAAAVAVGILRGANLVRVHDVLTMSRIARMTEAIIGH